MYPDFSHRNHFCTANRLATGGFFVRKQENICVDTSDGYNWITLGLDGVV